MIDRAAVRRRDGLRRALPAADPPDRHDAPQGAQQRRRGAAPATPAARGRSARADGGHTAVAPRPRHARGLRRAASAAADARLEVALDLAFQCSPDHPWVSEHPEWFRHRPDGTIQYAENPPKRYQDIYPLDFETDGLARALGRAARRRPLLVGSGVRDLPRRQPAHQAVRVLGVADRAGASRRSRRDLPAEAFTAPAVMERSPRSASRSPTRTSRGATTKWELEEYFTELTRPRRRRLLPPQLLAEHARHPPRAPAAADRADVRRRASSWRRRSARATASTARPSSSARTRRAKPGSEEYLDSEKYEVSALGSRARRTPCADADHPRQRHPPRAPALQRTHARFHEIDNDRTARLHARRRGRRRPRAGGRQPRPAQTPAPGCCSSTSARPRARSRTRPYHVHDLLSGARYDWRGPPTTSSSTRHVAARARVRCSVGRRLREAPASAPATPTVRRSALVQGRRHLRAPRARLRGQRRRRHRRLRRPDRAARLPRRTSASPPSGCCRSTRRRCATTATTSPTTATSTRPTARCATSSASSTRPTGAGCGSSPSSS